MTERIFSTILLWMLLFFVLLFGRPIGCFCLLVAASIFTQYEFYNLLKQAKYHPNILLGILLGVFLQIGCAFSHLTMAELLMLSIAMACTFATFRQSINFVKQSLPLTLAGIMYAPFMLSFVIKFVKNSPQFSSSQLIATVLLLVAISKFSDVGGLLVGCRFGKHKLIPNFSPNKTLEGLFGGMAASITVGITSFLIFKNYLIPQFTILNVAVLSTIMSLTSPLGDVIESATKRIAGVKDSGNLIPGIGGMFDLMDSLIFSLPIGTTIITHFILK